MEGGSKQHHGTERREKDNYEIRDATRKDPIKGKKHMKSADKKYERKEIKCPRPTNAKPGAL